MSYIIIIIYTNNGKHLIKSYLFKEPTYISLKDRAVSP